MCRSSTMTAAQWGSGSSGRLCSRFSFPTCWSSWARPAPRWVPLRTCLSEMPQGVLWGQEQNSDSWWCCVNRSSHASRSWFLKTFPTFCWWRTCLRRWFCTQPWRTSWWVSLLLLLCFYTFTAAVQQRQWLFLEQGTRNILDPNGFSVLNLIGAF